MQLSFSACTAFFLLLLLSTSAAAHTSQTSKYARIQNERRSKLFAFQNEHRQQQILQNCSDHAYLTDATAPFSVNGSALPEVDFDIGESYAGSMPIGNSTTDSLFFWFVPTANPSADD
ncbi:hypothetical protein KCU73_g9439, partial [Aureobasidium melanogenum]